VIRTPHRTKGPGRSGPFGRWPDDDEGEDQSEPCEEHPAGNRR